MPIKNLPPDARPREKLLARGPAALSDAELLAILLRTGTTGRGVLQMAQEVIEAFGGLHGLLHADAESLSRIKGLGGSAKRAELLAVMELARRAIAGQLRQRPVLQNPTAVRDYLQLHLASRPREIFAVLFLDAQLRLIAFEELFQGTLSRSSVYPREVVRRALHHNADALVLAHNHPSGHTQPSQADVAITRELTAALGLIDARVIDHWIVGPGGSAYSMAENGLILSQEQLAPCPKP